jgi:hypothetical protein
MIPRKRKRYGNDVPVWFHSILTVAVVLLFIVMCAVVWIGLFK